MAMGVKESNGHIDQSLEANDYTEVEDQANGEEDTESSSLLPPQRGGMSKNPKRIRQKVQWNDKNGNKLVEVLEFQPSDVSDSEEEDSDACLCAIM